MRLNPYDDTGISVLLGGLIPQKITGSSAVKPTNGFDTMGYDSAMIHAYAVAASGTPDAATLTVKLQESADDVDGDYADALDNTGTLISFVLTVTAADAFNSARVEGLGKNRKRFLRIVATPAFTNGTSPGTQAAAFFVTAPKGALPERSTVSNT